MKENKTKTENLFMTNLKTGKTFEFDGLKPVNLETAEDPILFPEPDGIHVHISGSDIDKIGSISIYFKGFIEEDDTE